MIILSPYRQPSGNRVEGQRRQADWLTEWLANKGQYVLLNCGCREDLKWRGLTIVVVYGGPSAQRRVVFCERHNICSRVVRTCTFFQYVGLKVRPAPDVPPF